MWCKKCRPILCHWVTNSLPTMLWLGKRSLRYAERSVFGMPNYNGDHHPSIFSLRLLWLIFWWCVCGELRFLGLTLFVESCVWDGGFTYGGELPGGLQQLHICLWPGTALFDTWMMELYSLCCAMLSSPLRSIDSSILDCYTLSWKVGLMNVMFKMILSVSPTLVGHTVMGSVFFEVWDNYVCFSFQLFMLVTLVMESGFGESIWQSCLSLSPILVGDAVRERWYDECLR